MISIMSYELNNHRIECLYRKSSIALDDIWLVTRLNHSPYVCKTFPEASQKMNEAIEELLARKEVMKNERRI